MFNKRWSRPRVFVRGFCLTEKAPGEAVYDDLVKPGLPTPMLLTGLGVTLFRLDAEGRVCDIPSYSGGWNPSQGGREMVVGLMPLWSKAPQTGLRLREAQAGVGRDVGFVHLDRPCVLDYDKNRLSIRVVEDVAAPLREKTFLELVVGLTEFFDEEFAP